MLALVGSLFVASLSTWCRCRDLRAASQAPSVTVRPQLPADGGEPVLAITAAGGLPPGGPAWILYT